MNYQRVPATGLHIRWVHAKGYYSVVQIVYKSEGKSIPVAQGSYREMRELLTEIQDGPTTSPVDLEFRPPAMKKRTT